jgi:nucleotide-binding universal stress UspA family protein
MFQNIVVPLDGSPLAECVLPHVVTMGSTFAATVTLLHVLDSERLESGCAEPLQWQLRKLEAQAYLDKVQSRLQGSDLLIQSVVLEGPAAQSIAGYVREQKSDLLILSSHGRGGLANWNVSGVVQKVIQDIDGSLLLVRAHQRGLSAPCHWQRPWRAVGVQSYC